MLDFGFSVLNIATMSATADPDNLASLRVPEKSGLSNQGLTSPRVTKQARNLSAALAEVGLRSRFVVRDRDGKFGPEFNTVWEAGGAEVICTPVRAPNANAIAERFVRTIRAECTDRLLIMNEGHARLALERYVAHYNEHHPTALYSWTHHSHELHNSRAAPSCGDQCSAVSSTNTPSPHDDRLFAPYGLPAPRAQPASLPYQYLALRTLPAVPRPVLAQPQGPGRSC